jgi:hypothetical protein
MTFRNRQKQGLAMWLWEGEAPVLVPARAR